MPNVITRGTVLFALLLLVIAAAAACGLLRNDSNTAPANELSDTPDTPDTAATVAAAVMQTATAEDDSPTQNEPDYRATIRAAIPEDAPTPTPTETTEPQTGEQHRPAVAPGQTPANPPQVPDNPTPTVIQSQPPELNQKQWLQDHHPQTARAINTLPWIIDGVGADESDTEQELIDLAVKRPQLLADMARHPWIRDGVSPSERAIIHRIASVGAGVAPKIIALPWLRDGISPRETESISVILETAEINSELAHALLALRWFYRGVRSYEKPAVESLQTISQADPEAAVRIAKMPFLKTLEPADKNALRSLSHLAHDTPRDLRRIMAHSDLPAPLEDRHADILTVLHGLNKTDTELVDAILDHRRPEVERRTIKTATTGSIQLAIVRTQDGAERSLDLLEHAVRSAEYFVNRPFPNRHIVLLFAETDEPVHHTTHIVMPTAYDVNDGSPMADQAPRIIATQIAAYYWNGNFPWLDQGMASFLGSVSERARNGAPITATTPPCPVADSIGELTQITPPAPWQTRACHNALGERFWLSLYQNAGENRFRKGLQQLQHEAAETTIGIEQITRAFRQATTAVDISADRWYNGSFYQRFSPDQPQATGELHSIDGFVDDVYLAVGKEGQPVSEIPASGTSETLYLVLTYSYHIVDGPYELDLTISVSYEDGFAFQRREIPITERDGSRNVVHRIPVGNPPGQRWARGRYWVEVFDGEHMVAQAEFIVSGRY